MKLSKLGKQLSRKEMSEVKGGGYPPAAGCYCSTSPYPLPVTHPQVKVCGNCARSGYCIGSYYVCDVCPTGCTGIS